MLECWINTLPWHDWGDRYRYKVTWLSGLLSWYHTFCNWLVKQFSQSRCKDWRFYYAGKSLVEVCPKSGKLLLRRASNLAVLDRQVSFSRLVMDVRWYGSVVIVQRLKIRHLAADDAILVLRDINTTLCH